MRVRIPETGSIMPRRFEPSLTLAKIARMDVKDSHCIFLDQSVHPMLAEISANNFRPFKIFAPLQAILWVVQGGQGESKTPESSMAIGLARCIRSENPEIGFSYSTWMKNENSLLHKF